MNAWDPIGVKGKPEAAGEYDDYVLQLGRRLRAGETEEELERYLSRIRTEVMGLRARHDVDRSAARRMSAWYGVAMHKAADAKREAEWAARRHS